MFNAARKISGGEQLASIGNYINSTSGLSPSFPYALIGSTVFRKENIKNYPQCSNHFECALRSGEHYFPSGKFFKLTIVLEPFRMRFEIGEPVALNLVYYWVLPQPFTCLCLHVPTTVSLSLHHGFTRPYLSQLHHLMGPLAAPPLDFLQ